MMYPTHTNELEPGSEFLRNFQTPWTGTSDKAQDIMNANANVLPTDAGQYEDPGTIAHDYKLPHGLGVARAFRKPDSQLAVGTFRSEPTPTANFGRVDKSMDFNMMRGELEERARAPLKKAGYKDYEKPEGAYLQPWEWNAQIGYGSGAGDANHSNRHRHYGLGADAELLARRKYEPPRARLQKMIGVDTELQSLLPNRTMLDPEKVISEDRTREVELRIPRNADVAEAVIDENIAPRAWGTSNSRAAHRVHMDATQLRQPIGNSDTGDRSLLNEWRNAYSIYNAGVRHADTMEDKLMRAMVDFEQVRGYDAVREMEEFAVAERTLKSRHVPDPFVRAEADEYAEAFRVGNNSRTLASTFATSRS